MRPLSRVERPATVSGVLATTPPLPARDIGGIPHEGRQHAVNGLFDEAALDYDWICAFMSFGSGQRYRRDALERHGLKRDMTLLDVATGTGLLARAALEVIGSARGIVGFDPSEGMLRQARQATGSSLVRGVGSALPFRDRRFDFLTMGYALRHVVDLDLTFREYARVLKPGGRVLLLEISRPKSRTAFGLAKLYFGMAVPMMARIGRGRKAERLMKYYWETIASCVAPDVVLGAMRRSGFPDATRTVVGGVFSEYAGTVADVPPRSTSPA